MKRINIFWRIMFVILTILLTTIVLFNIAVSLLVENFMEQTETAQKAHLEFVGKEIDENFEQLSQNLIALMNSPMLGEFRSNYIYGEYEMVDYVRSKGKIRQLCSYQSAVVDWGNTFTIYIPALKATIGNRSNTVYRDLLIDSADSEIWKCREKENEFYFYRDMAYPLSANTGKAEADYIIEVCCNADNLSQFLNQAVKGSSSGLFLFSPGYSMIEPRMGNSEMAGQILAEVQETLPKEADVSGKQVFIGDEEYLVCIYHLKQIDWYLIDFTRLSDMQSQIYTGTALFSIAVALLFLLGLVAAALIYKEVSHPIQCLTEGLAQIRRQKYTARIPFEGAKEFQILIQGFNDMAAEIQNQIESVIRETVRANDAERKELQAQINPHFLYNSLSFVSGKAKMQEYEDVICMTELLGKYYRYVAHTDQQEIPLQDEFAFVKDYLEILYLRSNNIEYEIQLPEEMKNLYVPRMILQPIVENCVVHYKAKSYEEPLEIQIKAGKTENGCVICVSDNGAFLSQEQIAALNTAPQDLGRVGVWNVTRRMMLCFGESASVQFSRADLGGLKVSIRWDPKLKSKE